MEFSKIQDIINNNSQSTVDSGNGFIVVQTSSANGSYLSILTNKEHYVRENEDLIITVLEDGIITIIDQMRLEDLGESHFRRFYLRDIEEFVFE